MCGGMSIFSLHFAAAADSYFFHLLSDVHRSREREIGKNFCRWCTMTHDVASCSSCFDPACLFWRAFRIENSCI